MARELPAKLFQFRIRDQRLWLALRLRGARTHKSLQQLAEELLVPELEKRLAEELRELAFVPASTG